VGVWVVCVVRTERRKYAALAHAAPEDPVLGWWVQLGPEVVFKCCCAVSACEVG
jgi:hypothetical protein